MGLILGVDGGNSKTALVTATTAGELLAYVRGPGTNSHAVGAEGVADVIAGLVAEAAFHRPADQGVFFLCGADVPADIEQLTAAVGGRGWAKKVLVDNDTFALLRAGSDGPRCGRRDLRCGDQRRRPPSRRSHRALSVARLGNG
jgi:N-acetylglucosamine kinase-like BadF-type ATPase